MTIILAEQKTKNTYQYFKRVFDVVFSVLALTCTLPFIVIICLLIYCSSPGPIFYTHTRVGKNGKSFKLIKFRTMYIDADKKLISILQNNPQLQEEWNRYYKLKHDPRVFSLGHFLRRTSIDEVPQFLNVLKGDMSIVGPRPCVEEEIMKYVHHHQAKILSVKPGITGLWQTSGRSNISWDERLKIENTYIDKCSCTYDLLIILKTIKIVFWSKGAC